MEKIFNIHAKTENVGDRYSSPLLYFNFPAETETIDFVSTPRPTTNTIIGGGGLIQIQPLFNEWVEQVSGKLISWGIGHNHHVLENKSYSNYLDKFHLNGIRDWNTSFFWIPCASCMHPAFNQSYEIKHEVVYYTHKMSPIQIPEVPNLHNFIPTIEEAIEFLGSAETVLTTSYHGAYWATLLGRKVIILNAQSTRFTLFKHQPIINPDWRSCLKQIVAFPEALEECRKANQCYYQQVMNFLG